MTTAPSSNHTARHEALVQGFIDAIDAYQRGTLNRRDLAHQAENLTTAEEIGAFDDELLSHTFWAMRHLLHQPACWAAKPEELFYLARCLRGEEDFDQSVTDSFREEN